MSILLQLLIEFDNQRFKPEDVHSKLATFGNQSMNNKNKDTTTFGLEDTDGNTVKVSVRNDQAKTFEDTLNKLFSDYDKDDPYSPELAEILFNLKNQFDIVNIEWPKFVEDEEQINTPPTEDGASPNPNDEMAPNDLTDAPPSTGGDMGTAGSEKELFNSLLQTMMADAEAKRQEALAKAAEARAREAEAAAKMADNKLKAEEEVADMEAFYDVQNAEKKEAKKLAKLAKYRHTVKQQDDNSGKFDDFSGALTDHERDSDMRMDQPSGENPEGTEPGLPPSDTESPEGMDDMSSDMDDNSDMTLNRQGDENEEVSPTISGRSAPAKNLLRILYKIGNNQ